MGQSDDERREKLIEKCMSVLADMVEKEIPERGYSRPCFTVCDDPGSRNELVLKVECGRREREERSLWIFAKRKRSDRAYSNFILSGTKAEILDCLRDKSRIGPLTEQLKNLSARAEKGDD